MVLDKLATPYQASDARYDGMVFRRCGQSGIKLPAISLGLWHNWGDADSYQNGRQMVRRAFDLGITHFDLANNYGPPPGSAEASFGRILRQDLKPYRDELLISTKAGWGMWPGPYGNFGSRKYLVASLDQSLKRMGLDYVDIFYHHRPDPDTPLEETMGALDFIVRSGRALYAGVSNYGAELTRRAVDLLKELGTPCLIHQPSYNMFDRWVEGDLLQTVTDAGVGCIVYSPLAQGLLTSRYLAGMPEDSRAIKSGVFLTPGDITKNRLAALRQLDAIAVARGQSLAQMSVAWVLRHEAVTSALIGASRPAQIEEIVEVVARLSFDRGELEAIDAVLSAL